MVESYPIAIGRQRSAFSQNGQEYHEKAALTTCDAQNGQRFADRGRPRENVESAAERQAAGAGSVVAWFRSARPA